MHKNESLFDSHRFKALGDIGKLLEDQFLSMLAWGAEQRTGKRIVSGKQKGLLLLKRKVGSLVRPKKQMGSIFTQVYEKWKANDFTRVAAMNELGVSKRIFYRYVAEYEIQLLKRIKPILWLQVYLFYGIFIHILYNNCKRSKGRN
ncbi:hypothetical protein BK143_19725 [Paenibacillus peoriae]|nr:hypothetical protein BK134_12645 [Paenibacillus peoriae]OMF69820.1 hypothetical protein BK143_19725 [Paenibacillus peoriae]SFR19543.1 hypothetical protein SAMN04488603_105135 [Paenibacillus sp. cl130]